MLFGVSRWCIIALALMFSANAAGYSGNSPSNQGRTLADIRRFWQSQMSNFQLPGVKNLSSKIQVQEAFMEALKNQINLLSSLISNPLQQNGATLIGTRSAATCPAVALAEGGQTVMDHCYTIITKPTEFQAAKSECQANGGTLAEPVASPDQSQSFYSALKSKFPSLFTIIENRGENNGIWLGYQQGFNVGSSALNAVSGDSFIAVHNAIFPATNYAGNTDQLAAAIVTPGTTWKLFKPTTLLPYICQYKLP